MIYYLEIRNKLHIKKKYLKSWSGHKIATIDAKIDNLASVIDGLLNGKIKAILGTADYSVSGHKFSSEDMISIYKTHKRIEEGKNVQELEKKLYNSFIDFYAEDKIKEPVKILDIRGILNDKDLSFTRIGMAKGGLVNA